IAGRLENAYGIIAGLLKLDTPPRGKIEVHLAEMLDAPDQMGVPMAEGGYAVPERLEIHEVYRADAPGQGLDRSLVKVLLAVAVGDDRPRPPIILDGLLALAKQRLGTFPPDDQILPALGGAKVRRELPPVSTM